MPSLVAKIGTAVLVGVVYAILIYLRSRMWEERTPRIATSLGWLTGCAVVGALCSCYFLFADPEAGSPNRFHIWMPLPFMIGMVYIVFPSVVRLVRALRGSGTRRFAALLGLGIVLALTSLSPLGVLYHYVMTQ